MTANRYKRPSTRRTLTDVGGRLPATERGNPLPTFRAAITDLFQTIDLERRGYFVGDFDTVFWDYWDDNYDRTFFEPIIQPSGIDAGRVGAVTLKVPGLYAIRATIDWETENFDLAGTFNTWMASNYDDGGFDHWYTDLPNEHVKPWAINHFRVLWPFYTGAEASVEIAVGHDNTAQEPLFIPGGISGYNASVPMFTIAYLGGLEGDPAFFSDVA